MATNELQAKITADISGLESGLKKADKAQGKFKDSIEKSTKSTDGLKKGADKLGGSLRSLSSDAQTVEGSISDVADGLGQGGLLGAASVIVGTFQLVIAKVQAAQKEFGALAVAQSKAVGSAQAEIDTLQVLVSVGNDEARSKEERQRALGQINAKYGDYLGNLSLEELATEGVTEKINELNQSLLRTAKIRGAQDLIAKESAKLFELISNGPIGAADSIDILQAAFLSVGAAGSFGSKLIEQGIDTQNEAIQEAEKRIQSYQKALQSLLSEDIAAGGLSTKEGDKAAAKAAEDAIKLNQKIAKERERINKANAATLLKIDKQLFIDQESEALNAANDIVNQVNKIYESSGAKDADALGLQNIIEDANSTEAPILALENRIKSFSDTLQNLGLDKDSFDISGLDTTQITAFENQLKSTMSQVELFSNAVNAGFSTLGNQISEAIIEGNLSLITFKDVAGAVVSSVIQSLAQLAAQFITNFIAQKALSKLVIGAEQTKANASGIAIAASAASALGPIGIGALPLLINTTLAGINAAYAPLYAFAGGGIVPGGSFNGDRVPALLNSGEMILNSGQQKNLFDILNNNLASLQGRSSDSNEGTTVSVLRGEDIYLMYERQKRKNIRFNGS